MPCLKSVVIIIIIIIVPEFIVRLLQKQEHTCITKVLYVR